MAYLYAVGVSSLGSWSFLSLGPVLPGVACLGERAGQDRQGAFYGATTVGYCPTRILGLGRTDEAEDIS